MTFSCFAGGFPIRLGTPLNMPATETVFFVVGAVNGWRAGFLMVGRGLFFAMIEECQRKKIPLILSQSASQPKRRRYAKPTGKVAR